MWMMAYEVFGNLKSLKESHKSNNLTAKYQQKIAYVCTFGIFEVN